MRWIAQLGGACAVALILTNAAHAQTTLRLGKAQANQFAFIPADIGTFRFSPFGGIGAWNHLA